MAVASAKFELLNDVMYVEGKEYRRGDTVELDKDRGDELVRLGALRDPSSRGNEPSQDEPTTDDSGSDAAAKRPTRGGAKSTQPKE